MPIADAEGFLGAVRDNQSHALALFAMETHMAAAQFFAGVQIIGDAVNVNGLRVCQMA